MKTILLVIIAALGFYIWTTRPAADHSASVFSRAEKTRLATPTPTPFQVERRTSVIVVPAADGSIANRWKTGPQAQTDLTVGRSW